MGFGNFLKKFKRNDTVIDLSDMQRRGIIKKRESSELQPSSVVNLTGQNTESEGSALGFLGSLAGASGGISETNSEVGISGYGYSSAGKQRLKGILRDIKGKVDNTYDKVYKLSDRLDLLEKKLERLERRAGYSS